MTGLLWIVGSLVGYILIRNKHWTEPVHFIGALIWAATIIHASYGKIIAYRKYGIKYRCKINDIFRRVVNIRGCEYVSFQLEPPDTVVNPSIKEKLKDIRGAYGDHKELIERFKNTQKENLDVMYIQNTPFWLKHWENEGMILSDKEERGNRLVAIIGTIAAFGYWLLEK